LVFDINGLKPLTTLTELILQEVPSPKEEKVLMCDNSVRIPEDVLEEVLMPYVPDVKSFTLSPFDETGELFRTEVVEKRDVSIKFVHNNVGDFETIFKFSMIGCSLV
jgi:hypothetical protein